MSARNSTTLHQDTTTDASTTNDSTDANADADATEAPPEDEGLSLDVTFEILKNERRRLVLQFLEDADERCALGTLAEHIAALENDTTVAALTAQERKRVYVGLYQCHLPKMDDAGIVDFDQNRGTVVLSENAEELAPYLDAGATRDDPWPARYLSVAAAGVGAFVLGQILAPASLAGTLVVGLALVGVLGCAVAHHRQRGGE